MRITTPYTSSIAIVGMACRYPDARSPAELWENVLAQRRAFRRMPRERLRLEDYLSTDPSVPDSTYATEAALIEGYEFDRVRFRVAGSTFRSADMAHWLALDIASEALADSGFPEGEGLPRDATGVLLGNTLTGEFSRANVMRLRWPYVRRAVEARLIAEGWAPSQRQAFLEELEVEYKSPFPPVGEDTLAGSLSNTIAGRICNHFDLKGGGYTVDGACASSLLAVANASSALIAGDLGVALAGGVDLSLDPFELVGFAKAGALASEEMRVYDARSAGFWPGEGCGFVVLMRYEDAMAQRRRIYATIRGWGISSDGSGGITRPEVEGQILALRRTYCRAGFGVETVTYFEGHGTGTSVGDATELQTLSQARREAPRTPAGGEWRSVPIAAIGSIKANIGHTKAAAGVAGLIKATMALHTQIVPPTTGCETAHPVLTDADSTLRILNEGVLWPSGQPLRAGVSAMGFGGINTHIVLEGVSAEQRKALNVRERTLLASVQDAELFLFSGQDTDDLRRQVEGMLTFAARLSRSEVTDLAAELERKLDVHPLRAALVASSPAELASRLETLRTWLTDAPQTRLDTQAGVFLGIGKTTPRLVFLFPGQGSPVRLNGGAWGRRFTLVRHLYDRGTLPAESNGVSTSVAQPAVVMASLAGLRVMDAFGITASLAIGHSLGELTELYWAGALIEEALQRIATVRGKVMAALETSTGAMASIGAGPEEVEKLLSNFLSPDGRKVERAARPFIKMEGKEGREERSETHGTEEEWKEGREPGACVVIAGLNSPSQTVISGDASAVAQSVARAQARGLILV
ncbi:acyltransferase domain-containing protein [Candidatus Poribacteria bacterium]|nr:acyltransferase domain-containing protein [Candidatus Poribacteria bacterium]